MNKMRKRLANILAVVMMVTFIPLQVQADVKAPISVSLEITGDSDMGTIYDEGIEVSEGDTAFDLIKMETKKNDIELEYEEEWKYVTGVGGLSQFDRGPNSGWMYKVNGVSEQVGAGDRVLEDEDNVLFYYTVDYELEDEEDEEPSFNDLSESSDWALPSVEKAIELGIIGGDEQGNINPKDDITRAEFVKVLLIVMEEESEDTITGIFKDVDKDAWYANIVEKAANLALVNGVEDNLFLPNETLSRQDMAVILTRAYDLEGTELNVLDIDEVSDYAKKSVASVIENNVMVGVGNDLFAPKSNVTREMAMATVVRLLDR